MTSRYEGKNLALSMHRRWVGDLLAASKDIPLIPFEKKMQLADVVAARAALKKRPSWCAIFTKAFALVAVKWPVLRQAYMKFPWHHIYEHPESVASVMIERDVLGVNGIICCLVRRPDQISLAELDGRLEMYRTDPLEKHGSNRRSIRAAKLPKLLRRAGWWYLLNYRGKIRTYNAGTFGVSVTAGHGATATTLISPLTSTIHYGVFESNGSILCRITFDHRVIDGGDMARVMVALEEELKTTLLAELQVLAQAEASAGS
jgi:hypothetical protein